MSETNNNIRLVDGFNAAQLLRQERPELFDVLATTQIEHHYIERVEDTVNHDEDDDFLHDSIITNNNRSVE